MGGVADDRTPLVGDVQKESDGPKGEHVNRTGTVWTAVAHIITAVVGSGVLSLAWSVAQLGWIGGSIAIVSFAAITLVQSTLLADCYRSPDPEVGPIRNLSYMGAVEQNLGEMSLWFCAFFQQTGTYGVGIAYTITSAISMRAIKQSNCYHREGHDAPCSYEINSFMLLFGASQIILSQIPDFQNMAWLSFVAAVMSCSYSFIGLGLGLAKVIANGRIKGGIGGVPMPSKVQKAYRVSQGLGDIIFAYPYPIVLLEIEDTLKSPPPENKTMKKASRISITIIMFFYLCCGCFGYAAFGDDTPGNLLTGFGFYDPYWLIDFANACIVLHLLGGYQIFSQTVFAAFDRWFAVKFPNSGFVNNFYTVRLPLLPSFRLNLLRLCYRTLYVVSTTLTAMLFPYFNEVLGILGAFNFWPIAIYFPVQMYFVQRKICTWTRRWILLQIFCYVCLLLSIIAFVGSVAGLFSHKFS